MVEQITNFINRFRILSKTDEIVDVFTSGCCYWFAFILANRFSGTVMFDPVASHFVAEIGGDLYDVTGNVTAIYNVVPWDSYPDETHKKRIEEYCVLFTKD